MNKKIELFEATILGFSVLLFALNLPIRNLINMKQKTMFFAMIGIFSIITVLGIIFVVKKLYENRTIPKKFINDSSLIIKSNYVFFVLSYLFLYLFIGELFDKKIDILINEIERIITGKIQMKLQTVVYLIILAPVMEELFFRRFLFRILRKLKKIWIVLITSIIFMLSHDNMDISHFIVGLGLARIYIKYERIELNIIVHSLINLISMVLGIIIISLKPDGNINQLFVLIPFVFILPNYRFWIEKLFIEKYQ